MLTKTLSQVNKKPTTNLCHRSTRLGILRYRFFLLRKNILDRFHFHAEYMKVDKDLFHHSLVKQTMVYKIRMYAPSSHSKSKADKEQGLLTTD